MDVIRSFSMQGRTIAFVSFQQLLELPPVKVGAVLVDGSGRRFVLTGMSSPRGDDPLQVVLVLRSADGGPGEPAGRLRPVG